MANRTHHPRNRMERRLVRARWARHPLAKALEPVESHRLAGMAVANG